MAEDLKLPWYKNPGAWFIVLGLTGAAVFWWFAQGQPGVPLKDGGYGCDWVGGLGMPSPASVYVENGQVVDATRWHPPTDSYPSLPFRDVTRKSPERVIVVIDDMGWDCTWYNP